MASKHWKIFDRQDTKTAKIIPSDGGAAEGWGGFPNAWKMEAASLPLGQEVVAFASILKLPLHCFASAKPLS
jgi:hypothetical protein